MNELQIFNSEQFGAVRVVQNGNEPWFVASDVCKALELGNPSMSINRLDDDEKGVSLIDTLGGMQNMTVVNEPGLYALVLGSRKPEARAFKRWITHEVIPSIRKNGGYINHQETMTDDELIANALLVAQRKIAEKDKLLAEQAPKVLFADAVTASSTSILIRELSHIIKQNGIDIGEKRLYAWLREKGYIFKHNTEPTQKALDLGLFEVEERVFSSPSGKSLTTRTTKVTGKGQQYFINKFLKYA